jgi:hypothetical protein
MVIVTTVRRMLIVLRAMVILVLQFLALSLAVAVLVGLVIGAGWFGYLALRELWDHGYSATGPFQARTQLNLFVRTVTGFLGLMPLLSVPAEVADRITIEQTKKSWEVLLTTPLTGAEILSAKRCATARGLWAAGRWLIPLWDLGIACGSIHPLGAILAGLALPLADWAGLALGIWLGVRPGSTSRATSASALGSLGLLGVAAPTVLALLSSNHDLAEFRTWDAWLRWPVAVALLASPPLMGALAWRLTRQTYRRFDEWVGRPWRGPQTSPKGTVPAGSNAARPRLA